MTEEDWEARRFWFGESGEADSSESEFDADRREMPALRGEQLTRALVAGACWGFEQWRQGTREELMSVLRSYLEHAENHGEARAG